ncbi:MAG: hypothetical protein ACW981_18095 [Candidatus Hodarchaeales archaeon]|jgi:hypothetical protein
MQKTILILLLVDVIAATIGVISAIGSTCPTFIPSTSEALSIMMDLQIVFITTTTLSYVSAIGCFISIIVLYKGKDWFFNLTLISAIIGFLTGIIPAALVMMNGMSFSPSLLRTGAYLLLIIVLFIPGLRKTINKHIEDIQEEKNVNIDTLVSGLSTVSLGIGLMTLIQLMIVPETHIFEGIKFYNYYHIQLIFAIGMISMGLFGLLYANVKNYLIS